MKKIKPSKSAVMLSIAIAIASEAHCGVFDRQGEPYILHPIAVMQNVSKYTQDKEVLAIAILHDVLEDCPEWTIERLREKGLSERIIAGLKILDHSNNSPYEEYIDLVCTNYDTVLVKMGDIDHNSDVKRIKSPSLDEKDVARIIKYHSSFVKLEQAKVEFEKKINNRLNVEREIRLIAQHNQFSTLLTATQNKTKNIVKP